MVSVAASPVVTVARFCELVGATVAVAVAVAVVVVVVVVGSRLMSCSRKRLLITDGLVLCSARACAWAAMARQRQLVLATSANRSGRTLRCFISVSDWSSPQFCERRGLAGEGQRRLDVCCRVLTS